MRFESEGPTLCRFHGVGLFCALFFPLPKSDVEISMSDLVFSMSVVGIPVSDVGFGKRCFLRKCVETIFS